MQLIINFFFFLSKEKHLIIERFTSGKTVFFRKTDAGAASGRSIDQNQPSNRPKARLPVIEGRSPALAFVDAVTKPIAPRKNARVSRTRSYMKKLGLLRIALPFYKPCNFTLDRERTKMKDAGRKSRRSKKKEAIYFREKISRCNRHFLKVILHDWQIFLSFSIFIFFFFLV